MQNFPCSSKKKKENLFHIPVTISRTTRTHMGMVSGAAQCSDMSRWTAAHMRIVLVSLHGLYGQPQEHKRCATLVMCQC